MTRNIVPLLLLTSLISPAAAQSTSASTPQQTSSAEIVVTASALPEIVEVTPASVTVIDRAAIEKRQSRDVADVLREVPGLTLSRTGTSGKATSLFTRGGNSTHTLVLWNGVELNNPYFSGFDFGRFSTAGVDRIEIVRGPFSALYGSDAVTGVVNILTSPSRTGVELNVQGGENGLLNLNLSGAAKLGALSLFGSAEQREDEGWETNDDFSQTSANGGARWNAGAFSAGVLARATSYENGIPFGPNGDGTRLVPTPLRRQEGNELQISLPFSLTVGRATHELTLSDVEREDDFADPDDPFFTFAATSSSTQRARLTSRFSAGSAGTVIVGGEYETSETDDVSSFGTSLEDHERESTSLFVEDRLSHAFAAGRVEVSAGLRYDDFDSFGSELSPRLGVAFLFGSNKLRASYGHGFRAPSIGELYFPFSGNASLEAERSENIEVGFDHFFDAGSSFGLTLFNTEFEQLIVFDNSTFLFQNTGAASSRGLELGVTSRIGPSVTIGAAYTYLDTEQEETGLALLRRPQHSGSFSVDWTSDQWGATLIALHSGDRADLLPVAPYMRVMNEAYTTLDLTARMNLGRFHPYVKLENLTDERYEEVQGYRSPGRRASAGFRFRL